MTKSYDLSVEGHGFVPFCLTSSHRHALRKAVHAALKEIPGALGAALSGYSTEPSVWEIPPYYSGTFGKVSLQQSIGPSEYDPAKTIKDYEACVKAFAKYGWSQRMQSMLRTRIGQFADSPHSFDKSKECPGVFAAQYTLLFSRCYAKSLFVDGDTIAIRLAGETDWKFLGLVDGVVQGLEGYKISGMDVFSALYAARGEVTTKFYGVYDRIYAWLAGNFGAVHEPDGMRLALTLLKLSCHDDEEAEFEQTLRLSQLGAKEVPVEVDSRYTFDRLEEIRDAWLDSNEPPEKALAALYKKVSPEYLDSVQFKRIFGVLPDPEEELSERKVFKINAGLDKFSVNFLKRSRK